MDSIRQTLGVAIRSGSDYSAITLLLLLTAFFIVSVRFFFTYGQRGPLYPPGPPTLPIIGNLNVIPRQHIQYKLAEWARQYGDVISLKVMNQTIIALHSPTLVKEVFDKHGASNSNRPASAIVDIITPTNLNFGTSHYASNTWKVLRKAAQSLLTTKAIQKSTKVQHAEATQMIMDLIHEPNNWMKHCQRYTTSFFLSVVYGTRGPRASSPDVRDFIHVHRRFMDALNFGTAPPVDVFPILQYVPKYFAKWKREAEEIRDLHGKLYSKLTKQVQARLDSGNGNGCFMEDAILNAEEWGLKDDEWLNNLGGVLLEGADTTSASIQLIITCAAAFPDKSELSAKEILQVIGPHRVPRLGDLDNLPYTRAFLQECERFSPVAPIGIPHEMNRDEVIGGVLYPKGAAIFMNTWFISHDERYFKNPLEFIPERFLEHPSGVRREVVDDPARRDNLIFGGGRRICPGTAAAKTAIDIIAPYLLWAFEFKPALDPITKEEKPSELKFESGIVAIPHQFQCRIIPRSKQHIEVIQQEFTRAAVDLKPYEIEISEEDVKYNQKYRDI